MSWAVQTAIYKRLKDDPVFLDLFENDLNKIQKNVLPGTSAPMMSLGSDRDLENGADCIDGYRTSQTVLVWDYIEDGAGSRGMKFTQDVCEAVRTSLCFHQTEISLAVDGHRDLELYWQSTEVEAFAEGLTKPIWLGTVVFNGNAERTGI